MKRGLANPWLFIAAALVVLVIINVGYRAIVSDLSLTLDEQLGDQLGGLAETFAAGLEPAYVRGVTSAAEAFDPAGYVALRNQARDFAHLNRLVSATILDTTWQDPFAPDTDSLGRRVYSLLDQEGAWALRSGLVWTSRTFRWGDSYYRSAAAPVIDPVSDEWLAIVRIEADAQYFGALDRLGRLAWGIHLLSAVLALALVGLLLWYGRVTRRWETELLRSEKLIGLGRLAATIAHEIRNPLGIIKATAQRLTHLDDGGEIDGKRAELLRFIPEEVDRLDRILTRYLQIGALDKSRPVEVDLGRELASWIGGIEERTRIQVSAAECPAIVADAEAPRQVLLNLVRNALESSPDSKAVDISWARDGEWGALRVADRGPGISKDMRSEVFEPFFTTKATGTGLGLYAVKALVERDGGSVTIEDNPGGGTVFVVKWPLAATTKGRRD